MSFVVLDDHLLRDHLSGVAVPPLAGVAGGHRPATTNLFSYRLARSIVAARGGALTGSWPTELRRIVGARVADIDAAIHVVPMIDLVHRMAVIGTEFGLSTLGAEAIAACEHLGAPLAVWAGDDGPRIREAAGTLGIRYVAV